MAKTSESTRRKAAICCEELDRLLGRSPKREDPPVAKMVHSKTEGILKILYNIIIIILIFFKTIDGLIQKPPDFSAFSDCWSGPHVSGSILFNFRAINALRDVLSAAINLGFSLAELLGKALGCGLRCK